MSVIQWEGWYGFMFYQIPLISGLVEDSWRPYLLLDSCVVESGSFLPCTSLYDKYWWYKYEEDPILCHLNFKF